MISSWEKQIHKSNLLFLWYWFLVLTLIITVWLFFYNHSIEGKITKLWTEISEYDTSIAKLQEDKSIQVYNLLLENKKVIASLEKKSKVKDFIYHLRSLEIPFWLTFKWFNYSNWNVTMQAVVPFDSNILASNRVSMFVKDYRADKKALFDLDFISTFNWFDSITFWVNLKLK